MEYTLGHLTKFELEGRIPSEEGEPTNDKIENALHFKTSTSGGILLALDQ